jgi:hypothetical protein
VEKLIVVGYSSDNDPPLTRAATVERNERLLADLDETRFPGLLLQVEDHQATAEWQRRTASPARRVATVLAVWTENADELGPLEARSEEFWPDRAMCVVTETVPLWNAARNTSAVEPQPGVLLTSLLYRRPGMTSEQFAAHWRHVHQPMSLRIHPQHTYVRNLVTRWTEPADPPFDAICEEGFAAADDVLDPTRFYGADVNGATWKENAKTIGDDVRLFLDTADTTATIMREYRLREIRTNPTRNGD